jgi:hypothetical protein
VSSQQPNGQLQKETHNNNNNNNNNKEAEKIVKYKQFTKEI